MPKIKAKDCKCCLCGKQAVCFWPVIDPDIPQRPYCRKCVDKEKIRVLMKYAGMENANAKAMVKSMNEPTTN